MKNYFIILNDRIELMYQGRMFSFDLNDGDREDYWNSFTYNGKELDINYFPVLDSLTIYSVHDDTGQIDTSQFETAEFISDFTGKYVKLQLSPLIFHRYSDSKQIIVMDKAEPLPLSDFKSHITQIGYLPSLYLMEFILEKIKDYEKSESRRGA